MHPLARLDHAHVWHPFTQMQEWVREEPLVLLNGRGTVLQDVRGRKYLDANSSIWTNLHGHNQPRLNAAIRAQLVKVAHVSALGFANEPASLLARRLVEEALPAGKAPQLDPALTKVFFSDDGSTAIEVALKLAYEFTRRTRGPRPAPRFLTINGAYHGDTIGAVALGHIPKFHQAFAGLLFKSDAVMAPYCYRCPYNLAKPERADAREYRKCHWECVGQVERQLSHAKRAGRPYAGFAFEPRIQGAAGMIPQPNGWLKQVTELARAHGALLIADEVMTGFGRTGLGPSDSLLACSHEEVRPDFLCLAKGLTGGYLPMAATLTTEKVFSAFLGRYDEFKTFFHGHSFTGNPLGAAVALASLSLLQSSTSRANRAELEVDLASELKSLWDLNIVGDIRQIGLVTGIELVRDWRTRETFPLGDRVGIRVCEAMAKYGVLTRPIGNVIVLMPPYCTTRPQLRRMVSAVYEAIGEVFGETSDPPPFRSGKKKRRPLGRP